MYHFHPELYRTFIFREHFHDSLYTSITGDNTLIYASHLLHRPYRTFTGAETAILNATLIIQST